MKKKKMMKRKGRKGEWKIKEEMREEVGGRSGDARGERSKIH